MRPDKFINIAVRLTKTIMKTNFVYFNEAMNITRISLKIYKLPFTYKVRTKCMIFDLHGINVPQFENTTVKLSIDCIYASKTIESIKSIQLQTLVIYIVVTEISYNTQHFPLSYLINR